MRDAFSRKVLAVTLVPSRHTRPRPPSAGRPVSQARRAARDAVRQREPVRLLARARRHDAPVRMARVARHSPGPLPPGVATGQRRPRADAPRPQRAAAQAGAHPQRPAARLRPVDGRLQRGPPARRARRQDAVGGLPRLASAVARADDPELLWRLADAAREPDGNGPDRRRLRLPRAPRSSGTSSGCGRRASCCGAPATSTSTWARSRSSPSTMPSPRIR